MIEAIIFDMDGTLVDSERLSVRAMAELIPEISVCVDTLLHRYGGQQLGKTFKAIEDEFNCTLRADFEIDFRTRVAQLIETELTPFEGVHETLAKLHLPFCLATNAPLKKVHHVMRKTGLDVHFGDRLFSAYEVGAWKPNPHLFLHAAQQLGVEPSNCLVVEDSIFGIEAGRAAQMQILEFCAPHAEPLTDNSFRHYRDFHATISNY